RGRDIGDARSVCCELLRPAAFAAANAAEHERDRFAVPLLHATPLPAEQYSAATAGSNNRQPSHRRRFFDRQGNALQLSHRNWIKPRLASGRSPDSRIFEFEIPSRAIRKKPSPCGRQPSGLTFSISP